MLWEVGGYISHKLSNAEWGEAVVKKLAEYIRTQDSTVRGWSNHLTIISRCKTDNQRLFYMLYAKREHLLRRTIFGVFQEKAYL